MTNVAESARIAAIGFKPALLIAAKKTETDLFFGCGHFVDSFCKLPNGFLKETTMSWFKVFSAVVVANIVSWIVVSILGWFIFFVVLDSFTESLIERRSKTDEVEFPAISVPSYSPRAVTQEEIEAKQKREKQLAAERRRATRDTEQRRSAIAGSKKMCEFWTSEYRKDGNPKSQAYKEMACLRYRNLLN